MSGVEPERKSQEASIALLSMADLTVGLTLQGHKTPEDGIHIEALARQLAPDLSAPERRTLFDDSLQKLMKAFPGNIATILSGPNRGKIWWFGEDKITISEDEKIEDFQRKPPKTYEEILAKMSDYIIPVPSSQVKETVVTPHISSGLSRGATPAPAALPAQDAPRTQPEPDNKQKLSSAQGTVNKSLGKTDIPAPAVAEITQPLEDSPQLYIYAFARLMQDLRYDAAFKNNGVKIQNLDRMTTIPRMYPEAMSKLQEKGRLPTLDETFIIFSQQLREFCQDRPNFLKQLNDGNLKWFYTNFFLDRPVYQINSLLQDLARQIS